MKEKKKNTDPLQPDTYYHIYNRGVNGTRLFTKKGNTDYFLEKYIKYIEPIAATYAYVLMGNHFHFLIKTRSEEDIIGLINPNPDRVLNPVRVRVRVDDIEDKTTENKTASFIISKQFSNLFNTYAQAINKQDKRTGSLFERPFRRIAIENENYAAHLVYYIHNNPVKHGFTDDFTTYLYSSYNVFLNNEPTFIQKEEVLTWFGGLEPFLIYHGIKHDFDEKWQIENWIEVD